MWCLFMWCSVLSGWDGYLEVFVYVLSVLGFDVRCYIVYYTYTAIFFCSSDLSPLLFFPIIPLPSISSSFILYVSVLTYTYLYSSSFLIPISHPRQFDPAQTIGGECRVVQFDKYVFVFEVLVLYYILYYYYILLYYSYYYYLILYSSLLLIYLLFLLFLFPILILSHLFSSSIPLISFYTCRYLHNLIYIPII